MSKYDRQRDPNLEKGDIGCNLNGTLKGNVKR